jgi:DNA-binding NarL/FixJ family response regulator
VRCYLDAHLSESTNFITRSLCEDDDRIRSLERHPIVAALPQRQRDVVALVCLGKTNKEIAQLRNVGEQTIKNMLTKHIFRAFGVSSRSALVSSCLRGRAASE